MGAPPLEGVRVLEMARILAGPWAGQTLADLGAEVTKVESPEGDMTRQWGPPFMERDGERSAAYFHCCNRGKKSIVVDFRTPEGREAIKRLAMESDVLIENYRAGSLAKHGLDYDSLSSLNPALVYCSITGFGQTGPYASRAGFDFNIQGMSGLMSVTGEPGRQPQKAGVAITDLFTALYSASAILAALYQRRDTGRGQHIDMSLLDTAVSVTANQAMNYFATGKAPERIGNAHQNLTPYQVFDCKDGWIIIATGSDAQFRKLCSLLGVGEMGMDPKFLSNSDRIQNRDEMTARLSERTLMRSRSDLLASCEEHGIPAGPINDISETFADPQVAHRGLRGEIAGLPTLLSPMVLSGERLSASAPPPNLGEHTAEVLGEIAPKPDPDSAAGE